VEGKSGQEVARALGLTVAAVYLAKSRVMAKLKEQIRQLQGE
jgi:DNA-directed RNA polymerase specialized sigma24 family protein